MMRAAVCASTACFSRSHFTGKERDTESGNDYFEARYYSSAMGRFMSPDWSDKPDPIPYADLEDPQTLNLYSYVRNNPLTRRDLNGHCTNGGQQQGPRRPRESKMSGRGFFTGGTLTAPH